MRTTIFFLAIIFLALTLAVHSIEDNPHNFQNADCHLCHQVGPQGNIISTDTRHITRACMTCHDNLYDAGYIHPVDIRPSNTQIALGLPLSQEGLITCITCHDIHSPHLDGFGYASYFLRRYERGKAFCDLCHDENGKGRNADGHKALMTEAHPGSKYISADFGDPLDPLSKSCISCHDGSVGPSITVRTGYWRHSNKLLSHADGGHPVGIDYEDARLRHGRKTDLRPMSLIDGRIKFFDGKIGCGTCHNPFNGSDYRLVMSNYRSQLCFACHAMNG